MGRKAKHHYIPKCYLKGFTDGGENLSQFWCVPINDDSPFLTSPNDSCAKRDYYTVQHPNSLIVEDWYAKQVEPQISEAVRHIEEYSSLPPKEEMRHLILLLATLYLRVPSFRKTLERPRRRVKEILDTMSLRISNKDAFDYSQTDLIADELTLIDTVQKCLSNKYYQLHIIKDPEVCAITSDRPFILSHPRGGNGFKFGLNTPNIEIRVPITKNAIIFARNEKMNEGTFMASKEFVGLTNTKIILSADRFFYSSDTDIYLANVDIDDNFSVYKQNIGN